MRSLPALLAALLAAFASDSRSPAQGAQPDWTYVTLGSGIGLSGLVLSSVQQRREIIVGCGSGGFGPNRYWAILAHDATTGRYEQLWAAPPYPSHATPVDIEVAELGGRPGPELLVLRGDGYVEVWNQAARSKETTFAVGMFGTVAMALADVDADQNLDVVVINGTTTRAMTAAGKLLWEVAGAGGSDVVVAQMDADPALEIATTGGAIVDCVTRKIEWQWRNKFGLALAAADIDQDGYSELIVAENSGWVWSYDIDVQLPKWSINANLGGVSAVAVSDIDVDGVIEVLVGNAQWGEIMAFDSVKQTKEWGIRNPEHGTTRVAWGDVDADGTFEVLWGAGYTSTGKDALYVADWKTLQIEWSSTHLDGPFLAPRIGDVDGDNVPELLSASTTSDSGYSGARILVFDPATGHVKSISQPVGSSFSALSQLDLVQLDSDPQFEVLVAGERLRIYEWDPAKRDFGVVWELPYQSSYYPRVARLHDVVGSSAPEVLVGSDSDLRAFDLGSKQEIWKSFHLASRVTALDLADTDFDGKAEIHALVQAGDLYVFDTAPLQAKAILTYQTTRYASLATSPFTTGEILMLGDESGQLTAFFPLGTKYGALGPLPVASGRLDAMEWFYPTSLWSFVYGGSIRLQDGLTPLWMSAPREAGFGVGWSFNPATNSIVAADQYGLVGYRLF